MNVNIKGSRTATLHLSALDFLESLPDFDPSGRKMSHTREINELLAPLWHAYGLRSQIEIRMQPTMALVENTINASMRDCFFHLGRLAQLCLSTKDVHQRNSIIEWMLDQIIEGCRKMGEIRIEEDGYLERLDNLSNQLKLDSEE